MRAIRRLGTSPAERGDTTNISGSPDILALDDGSFAVIGVDITDELGRLVYIRSLWNDWRNTPIRSNHGFLPRCWRPSGGFNTQQLKERT